MPGDAGCLQCWSAVATGMQELAALDGWCLRMQDTRSAGCLMPRDAGHSQRCMFDAQGCRTLAALSG